MDIQYLSPVSVYRQAVLFPNLIGKVSCLIYGPGGAYGTAQQNPRTL